VADLDRQPRELVVIEIDLVQVGIVPEDASAHALQAVSTEVHRIPLASLFRLLGRLHPTPLTVLFDIRSHIDSGQRVSGSAHHVRRRSGVKMRLVLGHLEFLVLLHLFPPMLVGRLAQAASVVGRAILEMRGCEVRGGVSEGGRGDVVLVVAKVATVSTDPAVILMLVIQMMVLMSMGLALEAFVQAHLVLVSVPRPAIQQAVILPVAAVVVHVTVGVVRR